MGGDALGRAADIALLSLGGSCAASMPLGILQDVVEEKDRAQATALLRMVNSIGLFAGATLTGVLADSFGYDFGFNCAGFVLLATTANFARVMCRVRVSP